MLVQCIERAALGGHLWRGQFSCQVVVQIAIELDTVMNTQFLPNLQTPSAKHDQPTASSKHHQPNSQQQTPSAKHHQPRVESSWSSHQPAQAAAPSISIVEHPPTSSTGAPSNQQHWSSGSSIVEHLPTSTGAAALERYPAPELWRNTSFGPTGKQLEIIETIG